VYVRRSLPLVGKEEKAKREAERGRPVEASAHVVTLAERGAADNERPLDRRSRVARMGVRYRVLGPLEADVDGQPARLGSPKQRVTLALLLLQPNTVVPAARLVDGLWGEEPPGSATNLVQGYVSGLRKVLGREAIDTRGVGYVLHVAGGALDLRRFEQLAHDGSQALERDDPAGAAASRGGDHHRRRNDRPEMTPHVSSLHARGPSPRLRLGWSAPLEIHWTRAVYGQTVLDAQSFEAAAADLAARDARLAAIIERHGLPSFWAREPGLPTLVLLILEQQVSLASARAAYARLVGRLDALTPAGILASTDEELRADGFSRQKARYVRALASALEDGSLDLDAVASLDDDSVRRALVALPGIGPWTAEVYLLSALRRPDTWPVGDIALQEAARRALGLETRPTPDELEQIGESWRPHRASAARLLWHLYLSEPRGNGHPPPEA
jgi:DNA-3-methyladenine glycosylase II